jgi:predicted glycosyltransferase
VEKKDTQSYENRVLKTLNACFDALLIHADESFIRLDETFERMSDIHIPVVYTGFVTPKPSPDARKRIRGLHGIGEDEHLVVASAGGGKVGDRLLESMARAFHDGLVEGRAVIFTGPFMDQPIFDRLTSMKSHRIMVERFSSDFLSYLAASDLSVSMAGYNTSMNIMSAGVPAILWPFSQNREQRIRAERLSTFGGIRILSDEDLKPETLAGEITRMLLEKLRRRGSLDLNGAESTAAWIEDWMR